MGKPASVPARLGFRRDERGAAAIEFALVAPMLFLTLLSLVEIGVVCLMTNSVDNAVIAVSRKIRTGQDSAPPTAEAFESAVCERMGGATTSCRERLTVSVQRFNRFSDANAVASSPPDGSYDKGGAGDIIIVKANFAWPLVTPFLLQGYERAGRHQIVIASRVAFKNEPFQ